MVRMDIIAAAGRAYQTCWNERAYLLKLAMVPFFLKLVCFTIGSSVTDQEQTLRFMLIMLPALLAEGWMLSHFVRLLVLEQRWPFRPTGDMDADMSVLRIRARGVLSGMIVFVLINLGLGFLLYVANEYMMPFMPEPGAKAAPADIPSYVGILSMVMIGFMVWGFRLMWFYIPYALNISGLTYLMSMRGLLRSVQLIALWLLCFVPFFLALQLIASVLLPLVAGAFGKDASSFVFMFLNVIMDTMKAFVATAGVTYAWMQIFRTDAVKQV